MTSQVLADSPTRSNGADRSLRLQGARRPGVPWVALGVVAVLGGALMTSLLVQSAAERSPAVAVARDVEAGQVLVADDLTVVDVAIDGAVDLVPGSALADLIGQVAVTRLPGGSLIAPGQYGADAGLAPGRVVVGALLAPGELPVADLRVGDRVQLIAVGGEPGDAGTALGTATVHAAVPATQPGSVFVSLDVDESLAQAVSDVAAAQRLRLLLLPSGAGDGG